MEENVELLFRPVVKSSECHALGLLVGPNEIIADVGVGKLPLTRTTKLYNAIRVGDRLTANEAKADGPGIKGKWRQAVSKDGSRFCPFMLSFLRSHEQW